MIAGSGSLIVGLWERKRRESSRVTVELVSDKIVSSKVQYNTHHTMCQIYISWSEFSSFCAVDCAQKRIMSSFYVVFKIGLSIK